MHRVAVIGANYGDEGKGLITDYLTRTLCVPVVTRYNGGAQAGHTVDTGKIRHVFGHFSSGTLAGAATYLGSNFVVNPMLLCTEAARLEKLGVALYRVLVSEYAQVTTPYDMLFNQSEEQLRGENRHGSCGLGINATLRRSEDLRPLSIDSVCRWPRHRLVEVLEHIRGYYADKLYRLRGGGSSLFFQVHQDTINEMFVAACKRMQSLVELPMAPPPSSYVIYEGAQGLELCASNRDNFPYLTPSYPGLQGVCQTVNISAASARLTRLVYVTRAYLTRHGVGPLPGEDKNLSYPDATNLPNEFQGSLRFAPLDPVALVARIRKDVSSFLPHSLPHGPEVAMTCLDQVPNPDEIIRSVEALGVPVTLRSYGPTHQDIMEVPAKEYLGSATESVIRLRLAT